MKITYLGAGSCNSKGIIFEPNKEPYIVTDEVGDYLIKTFPAEFKKVAEPKPEVKPAETVKESPKVTKEKSTK